MPVPALAPVGTPTLAAALEENYIILVEPHRADGRDVGPGREVIARVTCIVVALDRQNVIVDWSGAAPGHDEGHETTGRTVYPAAALVPVFGTALASAA